MEKYKYLVIFIALVTFGLVGCGNTNTSDKGTEATTSRQEVESYAKNQTSVLCDYYKDESGVWHAEGKRIRTVPSELCIILGKETVRLT